MIEKFRQHSPALASFFLVIMIFTTRLSIGVKSIGLVVSLVLICLTLSPRDMGKTYWYNPIARAAALLYACLIVGSFYGSATYSERLHVLINYLPLLWIGIVMTFFNAKFPLLSKRFTVEKVQTYTSIFMYGALLVVLLGCLNATQIINITGLVHSHPTTDPLEYPFGTFSFSVSFAAYLSLQKMHFATIKKHFYRYLICFCIFGFFIVFVNHQRTALILFALFCFIWGYQHFKIKGIIKMLVLALLVAGIAYKTSTTFHDRTLAVVSDIQQYQAGNPASSTGLRLFFLKASHHLWAEKPFFGYGTGSFKSTYLTIDGYNVHGQKNTPAAALDQPHSDYAYFLVQLGLMGFFFFLYLLSQQFFMAFRLPVFERQCAQAFILAFMVCAIDTTLLFYSTSITDYFFFSALFYAPLSRQ